MGVGRLSCWSSHRIAIHRASRLQHSSVGSLHWHRAVEHLHRGVLALPLLGAAIDSNRRARRDSQYEAAGDGYIFDGPSHSVNPSSVSRMSLSEHGRRSSEGWRRPSQSRRQSEDDARSGRSRRMSRDSRRDSRASLLSDGESAGEYTEDEEDERKGGCSNARRTRLFSIISHGRYTSRGESWDSSR